MSDNNPSINTFGYVTEIDFGEIIKMKQTAYILYGVNYDDYIFHAIFTTKTLLDEYTSKYGIKLNDGYWHYQELIVNPIDNEGL